MVAVIQLARGLEAEHIALNEDDADGYNKRLVLDWCECFFGHLPWAFNMVVDSIEKLIESKVDECGIVLPDSVADESTLEDLAIIAGLNEKDIASAWHAGVEDACKNAVECL